MNFDQKILKRIEKEGLRPIPGWFFVVKDFFFLFLVLIGALASATAVSFVVYFDVQKISLGMVPVSVFWLGLAIVSLFGAKRFLAKVDRLYRISNFTTVPLLSVISLVFGLAFFSHGQTAQVESKLEKIPAYGQFVPQSLTIQEQKKENLPQLESERVKKQKENDESAIEAKDNLGDDSNESDIRKTEEGEEKENRAGTLPMIKGAEKVRKNKENDELKHSDEDKAETKIKKKDDELATGDSNDNKEDNEQLEETTTSSED